jgi:hypothetical protein
VKTVAVHEADLNQCIRDAQSQGVVFTRGGKPVALLVGVTGLDWEQVELGHSDEFWRLIRQRRQEKTISRKELDKRLANKARSATKL